MAMNVEQISACSCSSVVHMNVRTPSSDTSSPDTCHCSVAVQSVRCSGYLKDRCGSAYCPNTSMRLSHLGSHLNVASLCKSGCCIHKHSRASIDSCTATLVIWVTTAPFEICTARQIHIYNVHSPSDLHLQCAQPVRCTFTMCTASQICRY
jgi:hypothetical protein